MPRDHRGARERWSQIAQAENQTATAAEPRTPLTRERVLDAAIRLADAEGIDSVSMRKVGQELGVEAMSLYNHVANKEDLLNGMSDAVIAEIELLDGRGDWKSEMRDQALAARAVMMRHQWAPRVIETRTDMSAPTMSYFDAIIGILRRAGFSLDLTHHALHAMGSRILGFTQELFDDSEAMADDPQVAALMLQQMVAAYPNISAMLTEMTAHDDASTLGTGCDDDLEFGFALDLLLEGLEVLRDRESA